MWIMDLQRHLNVDNRLITHPSQPQRVSWVGKHLFPFPRVENRSNSQDCGATQESVTKAQALFGKNLPISGQSLGHSTHACARRGEVFSTTSAYFGAIFSPR